MRDLLCLHGGPGLSDYLGGPDGLGAEAEGWRLHTWTQRGVAPATTEGPFTVAQHVADSVAELDRLGLDEAVVLGHSWGGFLAAALVAAHPGRVRGLVLVDPLGIVGDGGFGAFGTEMLARTPEADRLRADELDRRAMSGEGTGADAVESLRLLWPAYFADPPSAPPMPELRLGVQCYAETFEDVVAVLASGDLPTGAATYDGPVEVVFGEGSPMPAEAARTTAAAFPHGRATGVPDAGHFPWLEQPGCVAAALDRLRDRL